MIKKEQKGFTIIEVLIVLAIAGLIMLIVFLAVPALQRNSRNTQYKNDVASYLGAANEWSNNNNGAVITADDLTEVAELAKLGTMTAPTAVSTGVVTITTGGDTPNAVPLGQMRLITSAKCDPENMGSTISSTSRAYAVLFSVESSGNNMVPQCQES